MQGKNDKKYWNDIATKVHRRLERRWGRFFDENPDVVAFFKAHDYSRLGSLANLEMMRRQHVKNAPLDPISDGFQSIIAAPIAVGIMAPISFFRAKFNNQSGVRAAINTVEDVLLYSKLCTKLDILEKAAEYKEACRIAPQFGMTKPPLITPHLSLDF